MTLEQVRIQAKKAFENHELTVLANTEHVQMFRCQKPGTWQYGFQVICADDVICLTGDIAEMLVSPGYGRNGTRFLRGSIESESYFVGKIKYAREVHTEYTVEEAESVKKYYAESYKDDPEILAKLESLDIGESGAYGEFKFHESWAEAGLDDHPSVRVMTAQTVYQLEALRWLAGKLDEIDFKNGKFETSVSQVCTDAQDDKDLGKGKLEEGNEER